MRKREQKYRKTDSKRKLNKLYRELKTYYITFKNPLHLELSSKFFRLATDYSLWNATDHVKRLQIHIPTISCLYVN